MSKIGGGPSGVGGVSKITPSQLLYAKAKLIKRPRVDRLEPKMKVSPVKINNNKTLTRPQIKRDLNFIKTSKPNNVKVYSLGSSAAISLKASKDSIRGMMQKINNIIKSPTSSAVLGLISMYAENKMDTSKFGQSQRATSQGGQVNMGGDDSTFTHEHLDLFEIAGAFSDLEQRGIYELALSQLQNKSQQISKKH